MDIWPSASGWRSTIRLANAAGLSVVEDWEWWFFVDFMAWTLSAAVDTLVRIGGTCVR